MFLGAAESRGSDGGAAACGESRMSVNRWKIERRDDGVLVVRIPSEDRGPKTLPDACFSFRLGDPQYKLWEQRYQEQQTGSSAPAPG